MLFNRILPEPGLTKYIECYWTIENDDPTINTQKIIPDGYPEIIIHYGNPYRININNKWELQSKYLVAGQITKHFYIENTGTSEVFGIKLKPPALTHLFNMKMDALNEKVVPIDELNEQELHNFLIKLYSVENEKRAEACNQYFKEMAIRLHDRGHFIDAAIDMIFASNGAIEITTLYQTLFITERQLQRAFKKYVGISPKIFARIVRFNYIFQLIKNDKPSWAQIAFDAGYYDQSHFIKNFKTFTGEDPSGYFFDEKNLANFFLKKRS